MAPTPGRPPSRWLRSLRPATDPGTPDAARYDSTAGLVCFPPAGGSAGFFRPLALALAPEIAVLAVQYPGRQDRLVEPAAPDLPTLADAVVDALGEWTGPPPVLLGHSMGALAAFEVARRWPTRHGRWPTRLVVSSMPAPSRHRVDPLWTADDETIVADLRRLGSTAAPLLEDPDLAALLMPGLRGDFRAMSRYPRDERATVGCPISVFTGAGDDALDAGDLGAWRGHTSAATEFRTFDGGHFYLADAPAAVVDAVAATCRCGSGVP